MELETNTKIILQLYKECSDDEGYLKRDFSDGSIHINNTIVIKINNKTDEPY
jgi:hypothetical protein